MCSINWFGSIKPRYVRETVVEPEHFLFFHKPSQVPRDHRPAAGPVWNTRNVLRGLVLKADQRRPPKQNREQG